METKKDYDTLHDKMEGSRKYKQGARIAPTRLCWAGAQARWWQDWDAAELERTRRTVAMQHTHISYSRFSTDKSKRLHRKVWARPASKMITTHVPLLQSTTPQQRS
eukprot:scaffold212717_cov32-Tisochrysis_lutea.AAC.2